MSWIRGWLLTPIFLPGEFHGQRSLAGYSQESQRVRHDWSTKPSMLLAFILRQSPLTDPFTVKVFFPRSTSTWWVFFSTAIFHLIALAFISGPCLDPFLLWRLVKWVKVAQSCPTLGDPMNYTVHGILQERVLEWVAFPFSRGSSQPRNWTGYSHIEGRFFTSWATREGYKIVIF